MLNNCEGIQMRVGILLFLVWGQILMAEPHQLDPKLMVEAMVAHKVKINGSAVGRMVKGFEISKQNTRTSCWVNVI